MSPVAMFAILQSARLLAVAGALWLALEGKDGWGWFLFVAVLMGGSISTKEDTK